VGRHSYKYIVIRTKIYMLYVGTLLIVAWCMISSISVVIFLVLMLISTERTKI